MIELENQAGLRRLSYIAEMIERICNMGRAGKQKPKIARDKESRDKERSLRQAESHGRTHAKTGFHWRELLSPEWIGLLVIGIGLIIVPYFRGLYFDADMMVVEQILCFLLIVTGTWKFIEYRRSRNGWQTPRGTAQKGWPSQPDTRFYDARHLFIFILLIPYLIGFWTAVAPYDNWLQLFRYFAYAIAFFIVAEALSRKRGAKAFLQITIQVSIGWTALFAIAAALGQVSFDGAVWKGRLASVFQYPNTFGIILAVGMAGGLLLTLRRSWWAQAAGGLFLIPMGYVFLLTLSRGAWLYFLLIYLLGMLLLPLRAQWAYILHSVPLAAGVGTLLLVLGNRLEGASPGAVWMWILWSMILGSVGYPLLSRWWTGRLQERPALASSEMAVTVTDAPQGQARNRWRGLMSQFMLPVVIAAVLGGAVYTVLESPAVQKLLPEAIANRVSEINIETHSVIERGYFNQDAYEIYRDHVIIGAGGGGWKALFQHYQDYPYWSTQSHNYFSQLIVETGTVGLILFAIIILYYLWRGFRRYLKGAVTEQRVVRAYFLVVMLGLLGHSVIDFNMSFGYVGFLIFLALAAWQAGTPADDQAGHLPTRGKNDEAVAYARPFRLLPRVLPIPVRFLQPATFLFLMTLVGFMIFPIHRYAQAHTIYSETGRMLKNGDVPAALNELENIIQQSPYHPSYHLTYGSVLVSIGKRQQDEQVLQKGLEHLQRTAELAPTNPQILAHVAQNYALAGEAEEAFRLIQQAMRYGPWDIQLYPLFMQIAYETGDQRFANGKARGASEAWQAGLDAFRQIGPMKESLHEFPPTLDKGRDFGETEEMKLWAGKLHYRLGQFQEAGNLLHPLQASKNEDIRRQAILWSMAVEVQLGTPVEQTAGFGTFAQHPDWGNELRQILQLATFSEG